MITSEIYSQLEASEINKQEADRQYKLLISGAHFMVLDRTATINDGIKRLNELEANAYAKAYDDQKNNLLVEKFVPASGAASRMFKDLVNFEADGKISKPIESLFASKEKLAFYTLLPKNASDKELAHFILYKLGYESTPKGLIPFHAYESGYRTPFEEHWLEGIKYAESNGKIKIHFTISEDHQEAFQALLKQNKQEFEKKYGANLHISFSFQKKSTDTIAVDNAGNIVMDDNSKVLLRPGGHGALIQNLNSIDAELIFVKNIDNVTHESRLVPTILYKKALAGVLLELKDKVFRLLRTLDSGKASLEELEKMGPELMMETPQDYAQMNDADKLSFWKNKLNRPLRVCGMVKNEGEPGGGPFWVKERNGASLQIVESAQIDRENEEQETILQNSTHFNPVDLVCYVKDYQGHKFDLTNFVDQSAAFITSKSFNGKDITVLERPGLWNGAMAYWNTIFVEVPIETFNPVKTINDLLKKGHQP
ncbi:MAG: DUF4301 family protein [Cyclobacteriaceae bacterium]|nr:DUF4301 family protein [Cyclobacteriaceae bacterium]